jgi:hypothetical protein
MTTIRLSGLLAALMLSAGMASADALTDQVIADLTAGGYSRIEIKVSPTRLTVEAIRGNEKLERVNDRASGAVLKEELEIDGKEVVEVGIGPDGQPCDLSGDGACEDDDDNEDDDGDDDGVDGIDDDADGDDEDGGDDGDDHDDGDDGDDQDDGDDHGDGDDNDDGDDSDDDSDGDDD